MACSVRRPSGFVVVGNPETERAWLHFGQAQLFPDTTRSLMRLTPHAPGSRCLPA